MSFDRTFCKFNDCKHWNECDRAYTNELEKKANKANIIYLSFFLDKPECYERKEEE